MRAIVIKIDRQPHPNADRMFVHPLGDGKQVCGSIVAWDGKELAVHIPAGAVVDTERPEFSWLKEPKVFNPATEGDTRYHRVQEAQRRSVTSYGLMTDAPEGSREGDDVSETLGVTF